VGGEAEVSSGNRIRTGGGAAHAPRGATLLAIAAVSCAILLFELDLIRIFSFTIWHHFTFMVISVALLGFGLSGVILQVRPALGEPAAPRAAWYALLFGATAVFAVMLLAGLPLDPTRLPRDPGQIPVLFAYYAVLVVPFTFAGLAVATLLKGYAAQATRLYAADLAGAGLGCAALVLLLPPLGAEGVLLLAGAVAALGAWLLRRQAGGRGAALWLLAVVLPLLALPVASRLLVIEAGPGKSLARLRTEPELHPQGRVVSSRWHALGRIDVLENTGIVQWTQNPRSPEPSPPQTHLIIDGDAVTALVEGGDPSRMSFLDYTLPAAGLQAFRPESVLIIGSGGGVDLLAALRHGARSVDAVEINPVIADLVTGELAERGGRLFERPEVSLHVEEGRSFLRNRRESYDAIVLSLIDTWAATASGAYSLAEGYLYTVEAFEDYLERLEEGGVLIITRWGWDPPRESLRLCTVAGEALARRGVEDPSAHVMVLGLQNMGSVLVKREPFTREEISRLVRLSGPRGFGFLYGPDIPGDNAFIRYFRAEDREAFLEGYPYDIRPVTDDSPFFFQFGRWRDLESLGRSWDVNPLLLSGRLVLLAVLVQALVLSLALLVAPLLLSRKEAAARPPGTARAVAYFFLIGLAFMLLEIVLMQRFTLFLGSPVYATAVVLAVLLAFAGLGSFLGDRIAPPGRRPLPLFAGIVGGALLYAWLLPFFFGAFLGAGTGARIALSVLAIAPLGFLLGVPFPAAIERLESRGAGSLVGWAWAANGCASVLGPVIAVLLAMDVGFAWVTVLGAAGYGLAFLAFGSWWPGRGADSTG
jgi:SAM-dependent methyltransferase